ncbi:MAG: quinolinate synthase NadA [Verrucomicrobiota bacterium]|nr:quinolinate synthase NadA [Verrucomicrobiota bacterium]
MGVENIGWQIDAIRKQWGGKLLILGHHYQRPLVLARADVLGDSLELARMAARRREAEKIVLCGVRFMAESADILAGPNQTVYMPDPLAGCPMADMADYEAVKAAWATLMAASGDWRPVVYVNSSATLKALCGEWGGSTCTSSNARRVFEWAFKQGKRVFFLPDEHLGRNTAHDLGIAEDAVALYNPGQPAGGLDAGSLARSRVVVWKGFCLVHTVFTAQQVGKVRRLDPGAKIIVHPECPKEVARLADARGSTSQIIQYVWAAPAGSTIVIGTEVNLVARLAEEQRGRVTVKALLQSVCANMGRTNERNLLSLLQDWPASNVVRVPDAVKQNARKALERMLSL